MAKQAREWAKQYEWRKSALKGLRVLFGEKRPLSVSIGIPAYNEEKTIPRLIASLLAQKEDGFILKEIIVASDGSTDSTVEKIKSFHDSRIKILSDGIRVGKSARLNQLIAAMKSDVQILADADITISDPNLIANILKDSDIHRTGLTTIKAQPALARTFFEKTINFSVDLQNELRSKWNHGNNYLSFRGCFLVLSNSLTTKIHFPDQVINNDAFIYFEAIKVGFLPRYIPSLSITYRSPSHFADHVKQSLRHQHSSGELSQYFDTALRSYYKIPKSIFITTLIRYFIKNPILMTYYVLISMRVKFTKELPMQTTWSIAVSTKTI